MVALSTLKGRQWERQTMGVFMGRDLFSVSSQMRELRERAGLSTIDMAKSLGVASADIIESYEDEDVFSPDYFSIELTEKIARVLIGLGKPSIRPDEVWALALPDARTRLLANRKEAYNESVTVRIPPEIVTGQLAANIMEMAAANSEDGVVPSATGNKKGKKQKPTDNSPVKKGKKSRNKQGKNNIEHSREENMKTIYQPVLIDEPLEAFNESRLKSVEDSLVDFEQNRLLPVYGQEVGGEHGEFDLDGNVLYEVSCPPQLVRTVDAYAVEISGETMWPRYRDGEIVYCDPTRHVKKGDFVVAQVMSDDNSVAPKAFVKMFSHHTDKELVLEQFNPPRKLVFPHDKVLSVHTITFSGSSFADAA